MPVSSNSTPGSSAGATFVTLSPSTSTEEHRYNRQRVRSYTARFNRIRRRRESIDQRRQRTGKSNSHPSVPNYEHFHQLLTAPPLSSFSIFGGLSCSFDSTNFHCAAEVADAIFNRLLSQAFHAHEVSAFFAKFCQHPVVFYAYAYFRLFAKDALQGLTDRESSTMMVLSNKTSALLRDMLVDLDEEDIEAALLSMALTPKHRTGVPNQMAVLPSHGFRVEHTTSDLVNALKPADTFFLPAARFLADRKGGLHKLETPGLAKILIGSDISQASDNFAPLIFSDLQDHLPMRDLAFDAGENGAVPGLGFDTMIPGGLPQRARVLFKNLSALDQMLAHQRGRPPQDLSENSGQHLQCFISVRTFLHYHLLCLPSCQKMDISEQRQCSMVIYESCRLAALLYFNAAMRLTPQSTGPGIDEPVRLLRVLVEQSQHVSAVAEAQDVSAFYFWVLFIGGIGAYRSRHWDFFVHMIATKLEKYRVDSLQAVNEMVKHFVWSDDVCSEGAAVLWEAAQRERQSLRSSGWMLS